MIFCTYSALAVDGDQELGSCSVCFASGENTQYLQGIRLGGPQNLWLILNTVLFFHACLCLKVCDLMMCLNPFVRYSHLPVVDVYIYVRCVKVIHCK